MSTERYKLDYASRHHVTDKVTADIDVVGELASNRIFGHGDTREIIFVDMCRGSLSISKVCVECLFIRSPSRAPYRTPPASRRTSRIVIPS